MKRREVNIEEWCQWMSSPEGENWTKNYLGTDWMGVSNKIQKINN